MVSLRSDSRLDMTTLFDGYRLSSGSVSQSGTALSFSLYYPGGYYPPMTVTLTGTGFAFDGDGTPTAGTVTGMSVILDRYDPDMPGAWLEDISIPLTSVLPSGPSTMIDTDYLFAAVMAGADTVELGSGSIGYGDANIVSGFTGSFGADTMTLTGTDGNLFGDAHVILSGTDATGGDDVLRATGETEYALRLIGDVQGMTGGLLRGGDDDLRIDAGGTYYGENLSVGDVSEVSGSATLIGGDDTMIGSAALADQMYGDAKGLYSPSAVITGGDDAMNGRGGNDLLYGDVDVVEGGVLTPGNDTLVGGEGNDTLFGDFARVTGGGTVASGGHDLLLGGEGDDILLGNGGNDTLDGGPGADTLAGGEGDDVYVIDADDVISERDGEGFDVIHVAGSYSLGEHAEVLLLLGVTDFDGTGNALGNTITGNAGSNLLDGAQGNDTLIGGGGNDTFLDAAGADRMEGGTGDDLYYIDDEGDLVVELTGEGIDRVETIVSFALRDHSQHLETLVLAGQEDIDGIGNALGNVLIGNDGNNLLNGAMGNDTLIGGAGHDRFLDDGGADRMEGGGGNDLYRVDNAGDEVVELVWQGYDRVESSISLSLRDHSQHIEALTLLGGAALDGTGNGLDNLIVGNGGANLLNGAWGNDTLIGGGGHDRFLDDGGADRMEGGAGNDLYRVDHLGDTVVELAGQGFDRVESAVSFALTGTAGGVESLILTGAKAIDGTGNALDNIIRGNWGANRLEGGAGHDILIGLTGADTLVGGADADTFRFETAPDKGPAVIADFESGTDSIQLAAWAFGGLPKGQLAASAFHAGAAAADAGDRILYDAASGALRFDPDGSGSASAILFAELGAGTALNFDEIFVI